MHVSLFQSSETNNLLYHHVPNMQKMQKTLDSIAL